MEEKQEKSRIDRQFDFIREIDKEKFITRQTFLSDAKRRENDAEHAWHMAIMTLLLSEYANEEIDVLRVISMLLIHDLVEIDAGDTYAYDEEGKQTQGVRLSQILERNAHTAEGSQKLWDYAYTNFIEPNVKTGKIKDDTK